MTDRDVAAAIIADSRPSERCNACIFRAVQRDAVRLDARFFLVNDKNRTPAGQAGPIVFNMHLERLAQVIARDDISDEIAVGVVIFHRHRPLARPVVLDDEVRVDRAGAVISKRKLHVLIANQRVALSFNQLWNKQQKKRCCDREPGGSCEQQVPERCQDCRLPLKAKGVNQSHHGMSVIGFCL